MNCVCAAFRSQLVDSNQEGSLSPVGRKTTTEKEKTALLAHAYIVFFSKYVFLRNRLTFTLLSLKDCTLFEIVLKHYILLLQFIIILKSVVLPINRPSF